MFYKPCIFIFSLLVLQSCKPKKQIDTQQVISKDSASINKYFSLKQFDAALSLADNTLDKLKQHNNPNPYIHYCNDIVIKLVKNQGSREHQKKYYTRLCMFADNPNIDTISHNFITNAYFNWSLITYQNGEHSNDSLIPYLEKTLSLNKLKPSLNFSDEEYTVRMLGILYNQIGDLKKTLAYYQLNSAKVDTNHKNWVAIDIINNSIVLKEMGKLDTAANLIQSILRYPIVLPLKKVELFTILSEIQTQKKKYTDAGISINRALQIIDTFKISPKAVEEKKSMVFKQKGILERINNQPALSIVSQKKALIHYMASGTTKGRSIAKIYTELGKSYEKNQQIDSALNSFQLALRNVVSFDTTGYYPNPEPNQLFPENAIMEALDAKAGTLQLKYALTDDKRDLIAAVQCYQLSFDVERKLMRSFSYDESRLIMLEESKKRSEAAIHLCYRLFQLTKDKHWAEEAFLFAEKSKSFVLLESIKRNIAKNSVLQNDSVYQRIQYLNARLAILDKDAAGAYSEQNKDSILSNLAKHKSTLTNELLFANNELSRSNPAYKAITEKEVDLSVAIIQEKLLDDRTAIIEFFSSDSSTYIFSFTKDSQCTFLKTTDTIGKTLQNFLSFFSDKNNINNDPGAYQARANKLYTQLYFNTLDNNSISKYIIIPDGKFNFLPFEALVTSIKTGNNPKYFDYVLQHKQINYNYSAATILKQTEYQNSAGSNAISCFAPVFANNERGNTPLMHSIEEFDAIKKQSAKGQYFLKEQASIGNFKTQIKTSGILHIATHANANIAKGLMQPQIEFYDSTLYLNELYAIHTNSNLVVLSACQSGIGEINSSEGAMSLARGFYYAGARNIITSLWNANDKSTAGLFSKFYTNISSNNYTEAMQKAKLEYLQNSSATTASPYYWAGFIHIGYSKNKTNNNNILWFIVAFAGLGVLFFLFKYKK